MIPADYIFSSDPNQLSKQLTEVYNDLSGGINGYIHQWEPSIYGSTTVGTTTYTNRSGWAFRRGILVELFMDVEWTATTGSGSLVIGLPYKVANVDQQPFVGTIENRGGITFTGGYTYLTWRALSNSFEGRVRENGSGVSSQSISLPSSGRLIGHVRYIGNENESNE